MFETSLEILGEGLNCDSPSSLTGRENVNKVLMRKIYSSPLVILLVNWWEHIQGSICWDDIILVWSALVVNKILKAELWGSVEGAVNTFSEGICSCLDSSHGQWRETGTSGLQFISWSSLRSGEWGWKSAFALCADSGGSDNRLTWDQTSPLWLWAELPRTWLWWEQHFMRLRGVTSKQLHPSDKFLFWCLKTA